MRASIRYNNLGIEALALLFVLQKSGSLPLAKVVLILPITAHRKMLSHLSNGGTKIQSFEKYIIQNISYFSNFNKRFYDNLVSTINALQLLTELDVVRFDGSNVMPNTDFGYNNSMGKRAQKIHKASNNISRLLSESSDVLYLNMRVEL